MVRGEESGRRATPLGFEARGFPRPGRRPARPIKEDRAPSPAPREGIAEEREEARRTHLGAAAVHDRREFAGRLQAFRRMAQGLRVLANGPEGCEPEALRPRADRVLAHRSEAQSEGREERAEGGGGRHGGETAAGGPVAQRETGILRPFLAAQATASG